MGCSVRATWDLFSVGVLGATHVLLSFDGISYGVSERKGDEWGVVNE